jgi:hypothetical protein
MVTGMAGVYLVCGATALGWIALIVAFIKQVPHA